MKLTVEINNRTRDKINNKIIKETVRKFFKYFKLNDKKVSLALVGDKEIKKLNKKYRNIDHSTDVLSFPEKEDKHFFYGEKGFLGEVIIGWPQVKRQAKEYQHTASHELSIILAHGLLHLLGYQDDTKEGQRRMARLVEQILK